MGPRTELEIQQSQQREVQRPGWTALDRSLERFASEEKLTPQGLAEGFKDKQYRRLLIGRLQYLEQSGLCDATPGKGWQLSKNLQKTLQAIGRQGDIVRTKAPEIAR